MRTEYNSILTSTAKNLNSPNQLKQQSINITDTLHSLKFIDLSRNFNEYNLQ